MSSPGQKRGNCGHAMASFDGHSFCARCRDKGKGKDPCVETLDAEYKFCIVLTPEHKAQLAMPSYKVYPVMENLEKSWNSIFFFQTWKSHGN